MTTDAKASRIDLSGGLVPKEKEPGKKVNFSSGLFSRENSQAAPEQPPAAASSQADSTVAAASPAAVAPGKRRPTPADALRTMRQTPSPLHIERSAEPPAAAPTASSPEPFDFSAPQKAPSQPAAASTAPTIPHVPPVPAPPSQPAPGREPQPPSFVSPAVRPLDATELPGAASTPSITFVPQSVSPDPPSRPWQPSPQRSHIEPPAPLREPPAAPVPPAESPSDAAKRMSGLRNLILSLGLKKMDQSTEADQPDAVPPEAVQQRPSRPVYPSSVPLAAAVAAPQQPAGNSPILVTAQPEILPPRPEAEEKSTKTSRRAGARLDRRDTWDDVEILPSWKGQYPRRG